MHKVNHIGIGGFRRLNDVNLDMRPLMVMIGANAVGKTSLLDALSLLSASAAGTMSRKLSEMGGVADVLTRGRSADIVLRAEMEVPGHEPLTYNLHIEPKGQEYSISHEVLSQAHLGYPAPFKHIESRHTDIRYFDIGTGKLVRPVWEHTPLESSLSQVPKMFREPEELRRTLSSVTQYHVLDVGPRAPVKLPQQMKPADLPGENGEDLVSFLYSLRESNRDCYEAIEDTLKTAFPGFSSLNFPPVAAGMLSMTWKEKSFKNPLYMHQLSEGTLRFLWLISLLQSPGLSTVTMIDEPEVSLHPELLSILADLMREASQKTQIIVATHSDRLIRFLEPKEVVVMDIGEDGFTTAYWADTLDLDEWLAEYSLDEVWRLGRMGGSRMKISIIVEGKTEKAFVPYLRKYLEKHLSGRMPNLDPLPYNGRIPSGNKLQRVVANLLSHTRNPADHVIALTDVHTGTQPPDFSDAADAKKKMREWVGNEKRFHPHAAQHDFEAWLLPYWPYIQRLAGHNKAAPQGNPESVNHNNPPSYRIKEVFRIGRCRNDYIKARDAGRILRDNDLSVAVFLCPELKALINTILAVCGGEGIR